MNSELTTATWKRGRAFTEIMNKVNEPSYWPSYDKKEDFTVFDKSVHEIEDIDEITFKNMRLDFQPIYHWFSRSLDDYQKEHHFDIAVFCATVNALSGLFMMGERILIPTLIQKEIAAYILGMKNDELARLKFLHRYRFNSQIYYLNTEVYDFLDRRKYGKQKPHSRSSRKK